MNELKEYKPLAIVFYVDESGELDTATIDDKMADKFIEQMEDSKFVTIWDITINTYNIKEIKRANSLSDVEKVYYSQPIGFRDYVLRRLKGVGYEWNFLKFKKEINKDKVLEMISRWANDFTMLSKEGGL